MARPVQIHAEISARDMYRYLMFHSFGGTRGAMKLTFSLLFLALSFASYGKVPLPVFLALVLFGLLNPIVSPLMFRHQAKRAVEGSRATDYTFDPERMLVSDDKNRSEVPLQSLYCVRGSRDAVYVYVDMNHAFILPNEQLGDKRAKVLSLMKRALSEGRYQIRN